MKAEGAQWTWLSRIGSIGAFKGRRPIILIAALLLAIGVGYQVYQTIAGPAKTVAATIPIQVQRGTVSTTVSAPGTVVATKQAKLTFGASGKIASISASVGDSVKAGQELGKLDTTNLQASLAQAQSNLRTAQINLQVLQKGGTAEALAAAQAAYDSAVAKYNDVAKGATDSDIKAAAQTVATAQNAYDKAVSDLAATQASPDPDGIQAAQLSLQQSQDKLNSTRINRNGTCGNDASTGSCKSADASVGAAETAVNQAALQLQIAQASKGSALAIAQNNAASTKAALDAAQAKLASVKAGPTQAELLSAQNAVDSAKATLTKTTGATPEEIALSRESVNQAEAAVKQSQLTLDTATILAPFDGTIGSIGANVGEQASSSAAMFTLVDPMAIRIDVNVPEADVAKVALGQMATITFDALSGQIYNGKVIAVSPSATVSSGVASYLVSISIDPRGQTIPPGLSASASIITEQKDNVLIVPSKAIKTVSGVKTVQVLTSAGTTDTRTVQVGINGDNGVEIVSGLNDSDQVVVPASSGSTSNASQSQAGAMRIEGGVSGPRN